MGTTRPEARLLSLDAWSDVARNFRGDWEMLWKEITGGFLIAGFIALLPMSVFNDPFITHTGGWCYVPGATEASAAAASEP